MRFDLVSRRKINTIAFLYKKIIIIYSYFFFLNYKSNIPSLHWVSVMKTMKMTQTLSQKLLASEKFAYQSGHDIRGPITADSGINIIFVL